MLRTHRQPASDLVETRPLTGQALRKPPPYLVCGRGRVAAVGQHARGRAAKYSFSDRRRGRSARTGCHSEDQRGLVRGKHHGRAEEDVVIVDLRTRGIGDFDLSQRYPLADGPTDEPVSGGEQGVDQEVDRPLDRTDVDRQPSGIAVAEEHDGRNSGQRLGRTVFEPS